MEIKNKLLEKLLKFYEVHNCPPEYYSEEELDLMAEIDDLKLGIPVEKTESICTACSGSGYYCGRPCGACDGTGFD